MITLLLVMELFFIFGDREEQAYWDWQLTQPYNLDIDVKVLALDPIDHDGEAITALRARGIKPVCYISIGTWESYRADAGQFPKAVLGKAPGDWPDEQYLDIRQRDVIVPIMAERVKDCAEKGFAALELDNMDMAANDTGFDLSQEDALTYLREIVAVARSHNLEVAQKNAPVLIETLVEEMDFLIVEECFAYNFCSMVQPYLDAGKDVLAVEYADAGLDWDQVCAQSKEMGLRLLLKDREITAGGQACK